MAGMNIHTATEKLKTFLEANLIDPINKRVTQNLPWIYSSGSKIDLDKGTFPKILLQKTDQPSDKPLLAIGNVATENTDLIFIEIKTLVGATYTDKVYGTSTTHSATAFAALIAQEAEDLIKLNRQWFIDNGFLDVTTPQDVIESDRDRNPTFRLGIQMHYISSPN